MNRINMKSVDSLVSKLLGRSALGESATFNRKTTKMKKPNPYRYAEAYAHLMKDDAVAKAEALEVAVFVMQRKAAGEADSEILKKAKNVGTDLWRKIKELLGHLIIIVEEFFRGLFDKTGKLEKLENKMLKDIADLEYIVKSKAGSYTIDENIVIELPYSDKVEVVKVGNVEESFDTIYNKLENAKNVTDKNIASMKLSLYWLRALKGSAKVKSFKDSFGKFKTAAKDIREKGSIKDVAITMENNPLAKELTDYITNGINLEDMNPKLKAAERSLLKEKTYNKYVEFTIEPGKLVDGIKQYMNKLIVELDNNRSIVKDLKEVVSVSKEVKLFLNKIKNAPTSVTGSMSSEELGIVRKICTRTTEGINISRKIANINASKQIIKLTDFIKATKAIIGRINDEREADSTIIKARGSRTK